MYKRNLTPNILTALADTPVVLLNGARQTGKSTLVQNLEYTQHSAQYFNLDDAGILSAARADPIGFIRGLPKYVILDEIQHAPELFRAIKLEVDRKRTPGRFLLTGSTNILLLPQLAESLAGRMEILTLCPLSQGEINKVHETFIDTMFNKPMLYTPATKLADTELINRIVQGGFPEILTRKEEARQKAWFASYITTILQRDVRDIANIEGLTELPRLLSLLAARATGLLNFSELSRSTTIPQTTLKRYTTLLEITFLMQSLLAWSNNHSKRLVKSPKIILNDTGLLAYLLGLNAKQVMTNRHLLGALLENFVVLELHKQSTWSKTQPKLYHFRTQTGQEVDIVLENTAGEIIGIEVKASATMSAQDFKGLHALEEIAGKKFRCGIVLYTGQTAIPFSKNLFALPINTLWEDVIQ